jgi:multidrug efflux pump subunit AcrA (membrane-fusion protein)
MRMDTIRTYRWPLLVTCLAILAYGLLWLFDGRDGITSKPTTIWHVTAQTLTAQNHTPLLRIYGRVHSPATSILSAQVDAPVQKTWVKDGSHIRAGQLMITLNDHKPQLNLQQQQAALADLHSQLNQEQTTHAYEQQSYQHELTLIKLAQTSLQRFQTLYQKNLVPAAKVEEKQDALATQIIKANTLQTRIHNHRHRSQSLHAKIQQQKALLDQANIELNDTKVRAPYAGRVIKVSVGVGQHVRKGEPLVSVFNPSQLELRGQIPYLYMHTLRQQLAQQHSVTAVSTHTKPVIRSTLARLASSVDSGDVAVEGIFTFNGATPHVAIGRVIALDVTMPAVKHSFLVPNAAIYHGKQIFLIKNKQLHPIAITSHGPSQTPGKVIITSPQLHSGDQVLAMQLSHAGKGTPVAIAHNNQGDSRP